MEEQLWNDVEIAPRSAVMASARQFAEALADTPQYREFEQAYYDFRRDTVTQNVIQAFQKKQASLKALLILNAVPEEDKQELNNLQNQLTQQVSVIKYTKAQNDLNEICQEIGENLSQAIGLDYGSSCSQGGCCG